MQIVISEDRLSAQVGEEKLVVGGPVTFKNAEGKMVAGTILAFAIIDKKDMNAPWCYAQENKTNNANWFSLRNWSERHEEPITPLTVNNEISDDDLL
jgi:hypothetical protein